jgi:hypothetical protein
MKYLVSYAYFERASVHDEPQLVIGDHTVRMSRPLDEQAVQNFRDMLFAKCGQPVSIIAITKLDES